MARPAKKASTRSLAVQQSATLDWSLKHPVRAAMRSKIRRILAKYDYPPDHEEKAIELVLQQAELLAGGPDGASSPSTPHGVR